MKIKHVLIILLVLFALLPAQAVEAKSLMAQTITLPERELTASGTYPPGGQAGVYIIELNTLPTTSKGVNFSLTRVATNPSGKLANIDIQFSRDNGSTWQSLMSLDFYGGDIYDKQGNLATVSIGSCTWPGEWNGNTRTALKGTDVRIVATVYQTFRTSVTINNIK